MSLSEILANYQEAISEEISFMKKSGGKKYRVFSGEFVKLSEEKYIYQFESDTEISLNDGMPVQLLVKGTYYKAVILNIEQFIVNIAVNQQVNDNLESGYLVCNPWFLLEALNDRLEEIKEGDRVGLSEKMIEEGPVATHNEEIVLGKEHLPLMVKNNPITFVWGPPGTGKTTTLANLSIQFAKEGKRVLIVSQSNISVDEAVLKIYDNCLKSNIEFLNSGSIMRYGFIKNKRLDDNLYCNPYNYLLSKYPDYKTSLETVYDTIAKLDKKTNKADIEKLQKEKNQLMTLLKDKQSEIVSNAQVIATTISKATIDNSIYESEFDVVIFDEASMAYVPQILFASSIAKSKFLCFGDLRQLAPISQVENNDLLKRDIYDFLNMEKENGTISHDWLVILDEQYRSHSKISKFVNKRFYDGRIRDTKIKENVEYIQSIVDSEPFRGSSVVLLDTDGFYASSCKTNEYSRFNIVNAAIAVTTAIEINKKHKKSVGIITPYAAQARLLRKMLNDYKGKRKNFDIDCSTIHQFQGSERDVIIFDTVENYPSTKLGILTSSNENKTLDRLVNVAVTRAKGKLIVIGNSSFWNEHAKTSNSLRNLFRYINNEEGHIIQNLQLKQYIEKKISGKIHYYDYEDEAIHDFIEDVQLAKEKILIMLPYGEHIHPMCIETIATIDKLNKEKILAGKEPLELIIKVPDKKDELKSIHYLTEISKNDCWPITIIDDEILWYGMPDMNKYYDVRGNRIREQNKLTIRILGKSTSQLVHQLIDIDNDFVIESDISYKELLKEYIERNYICPECGERMTLRKGRKFYTGCQSCEYTHYLDRNIVNDFLREYKISCPKDGGELKFVVTSYSMFLSCSNAHNINMDDFFK